LDRRGLAILGKATRLAARWPSMAKRSMYGPSGFCTNRINLLSLTGHGLQRFTIETAKLASNWHSEPV
jgi:hypothetical protein